MCLPRIIELTYTQSQAFAPRHLAHWRPESSLYPVSKSSLAPGVQRLPRVQELTGARRPPVSFVALAPVL